MILYVREKDVIFKPAKEMTAEVFDKASGARLGILVDPDKLYVSVPRITAIIKEKYAVVSSDGIPDPEDAGSKSEDAQKESIYRLLLSMGVVGFKPEGITLKSGRRSYWYANMRRLTDDTATAEDVARKILNFLTANDLDKFDYIYGIPEGGTKLAVVTNMVEYNDWGGPRKIVIGRAKPKEHGDPADRNFIGPIEKGDRVVVVEDVITTGGSTLTHLEKLKEVGVKIVVVAALFDRCQKRDDGLAPAEVFAAAGYNYLPMVSALDYLPWLYKQGGIPEDIVDKVVQEFKDTGLDELKL